MFSKKYSLSTKFALSYVICGIALVLSSVLTIVFGSKTSNLSFALSTIGASFAIIGSKLKFDNWDEMSDQHSYLASFKTLSNVILGFIILSVVLKASDFMNRIWNYSLLTLQLNHETIFLMIGAIFISLGYHFIHYEKYGEE